MALQTSLCVWPAGAVQVSDRLAIMKDEHQVVAYSGGDPVFSCRADDRLGRRLMAAQLSHLQLAGVEALAGALGVSREFVRRNRKQFEAGGVGALQPRRGAARRPHRLVGATKARAQRCLSGGWSMHATAQEVGVSAGTIRNAVLQGRLHRPAGSAEAGVGLSLPSQRAAQDQACGGGVATKRTLERALAPTGLLGEAVPEFAAAAAVPGAGVLLALPAALAQGLSLGTQVLGPLRAGFYGLQTVLLTLVFMAFLRLKTVDQLGGWAPGELGLLLGLDRAPEGKTVRRKLRELARQQRGRRWQEALAAYWVERAPEPLGQVYVDGHVRVYHGRAHTLPSHHVARRGRPMAGTQDFHVHDAQAQPLFHVTAEATESLLQMLDTTLLPEIRALVGDARRVLVVFDRAGWSPASFARWRAQGFDVLTYRKGQQTPWPEAAFVAHTGVLDGQPVSYQLAEQPARLSGQLPAREIRRLTDTGHQTAIITTGTDGSALELAHRMFGRWRQENFFRYMRQEYALDQLGTYAVEPADPERVVRNPAWLALDQQRRAATTQRDRLAARLGELTEPGGTVRMQGRRWTEAELLAARDAAVAHAAELQQQRDALPQRVPLRQLRAPTEIVKLDPEHHRLTDLIKMIAYRAESDLARLSEPFFARHEDEARRFLQRAFQASADLIPDVTAQTLTVRFHGLGTPRETRALHALCQLVTATATPYPGTDLTLRFEAPEGHVA